MTTYENLIQEYNDLKDRENFIKDRLSEIRESIATLMHDEHTSSVTIPVAGTEYVCAYQTRETQSCNYNALLETVGQTLFNQLVTKKESTALYIRKAPKTKNATPDSKSKISPKQTVAIPKPPVGLF